MKKISFILAILTLMAIFCSCEEEFDESLFSYEIPETGSHSDAGTYYYGFTYTKYEDSHIVIYDYNGADPHMNVPSEINGLPVTEISENAFAENKSITSVTIPESIKKIGAGAFSDCSSLTDVTVNGTGLSSVGDRAFYGTPYIIGNKTEFLILGDGILIDYCGSTETVTIPDGVKVISGAFENNEFVTEVIIPETVTTVGGYSFIGCENLKTVNLPSSVTTIGQWAFAKCISIESIVLPDSVTSIGPKSFLLCEGLKDITLSNSIRGIPDSTFQSCKSLTEITLPDSIISIDENAFIRCSSLSGITVSDNIISIGAFAFSECAEDLTVYAPEGSYAEEYCTTNSINFEAK